MFTVCLRQLNWRHTNYLAGTIVKNTNNLRLSDMTGIGRKHNFRFQRNRSNFSLVPFQLWINELERLQWKWKHFKLHMSVWMSACDRMRWAKTNTPSESSESQRPSRVSRIGLAGNQSSFQCLRKTSADLRGKKKGEEWNKRRGMRTTQTEETHRATWV